jgi:hypothetical protein
MNHFLKTAYDAGSNQALQDFGLTKEAMPALLSRAAKGFQAGRAGGQKGFQAAGESLAQGLSPRGLGRGKSRLDPLAHGIGQAAGNLSNAQLAALAGAGAGAAGLGGYGAYKALGGGADPTWQDRLRGLVGMG